MGKLDYYQKGKENLTRPSLAQNYLKKALKIRETELKALNQLLTLNLKSNNLKEARNLIDTYKKVYDSNYRFTLLRSFLEHSEYNFERERELLLPYLNTENHGDIICALADIDIQFQRYPEAFEKYQSLLNEEKYYTRAVFKLVTIKILDSLYEEALKILLILDSRRLSKQDKNTYQYLKLYINFFLGNFKYRNITNPDDNYKISRLFASDNRGLVKHLEKHKHSRLNHNDGCFLLNTNFYRLISEVQDIIQNMEPLHHFSGDKYLFRMPRTIGKQGDMKLKDLCVVTILSTTTIVTMYPINLSDDFDKEKNSHILLPK